MADRNTPEIINGILYKDKAEAVEYYSSYATRTAMIAAALRLKNKLEAAGFTLTLKPSEQQTSENPDYIEGTISNCNNLLVWDCRWLWRDNNWSCSRVTLVSSDNTLMKAFSSK